MTRINTNKHEYIVKQRISEQPFISGHRVSIFAQELLRGEIEGIRLHSISIHRGGQLEIKPIQNEIRLFMFIRGACRIDCDASRFESDETAVLIPGLNSPFVVRAEASDVRLLSIRRKMNDTDRELMVKNNALFPFFRTRSDCIPYREAIKSEKTMNRMFVPENIAPRISIGSVQTTGPDVVAAHEHPMLEQLYYGLEENHCHVRANDHETVFEENTLLHIPLGSRHGIRVEQGYRLHYIWMDFFGSQKDMCYITESHLVQDTC